MTNDGPRWRRRKTDRPGEILEAALAVFVENGFAAARLAEIARRAGVSKAAVYLYFETKEDLFAAVARRLVTPDLTQIAEALEAAETPFAELAPLLLEGAAALLSEGRASGLVRLVISESRTFPDLARIWREDVVEQVLARVARLIARAQSRGEVVPGDPRLHAFTLMGPVVMGALYRVVFGGESGDAPDLPALAHQHARTVMGGLLTSSKPRSSDP